MAKWGYFSCDENSGEVVAKTEVRSDGTVHRYDYTKPDDIKAGHGHKKWDDVDRYVKDNEHPDQTYRTKDAQNSQDRRWYGNGYGLGINSLGTMSIDDLYNLKSSLETEYVHSTFEIMENVLETQEQQLSKKLLFKK